MCSSLKQQAENWRVAPSTSLMVTGGEGADEQQTRREGEEDEEVWLEVEYQPENYFSTLPASRSGRRHPS